MDSLMRHALSHLEAKLNAFLSSLTSSPTAAHAPAAALELFAADDALARALQTLRAHHRNVARLHALHREADALERKVKATVRDVLELSEEIGRARCDGEDEGSTSGEETDEEEEEEEEEEKRGADETDDTIMSGMPDPEPSTPPVPLPLAVASDRDGAAPHSHVKPRKELDYTILVAFARRISRYYEPPPAAPSQQQQETVDADQTSTKAEPVKEEPTGSPSSPSGAGAGAGAGAGIPRPSSAASNASSTATDLINAYTGQPAEPHLHLPPEQQYWLDEPGVWLRRTTNVPWPSEEQIRRGIMGRLQVAALESGADPEAEVERLMAQAEARRIGRETGSSAGAGAERGGDAAADAQGEHALLYAAASPSHAYLEAAGEYAGANGAGIDIAAVSRPRPAAIDLDLFDPSDEDDD